MSNYRNSLRILVDVLTVAKDGPSREGMGVTAVLTKANLSYMKVTSVLKELVRAGLVEEVSGDAGSKYRISPRGLQFLDAYQNFREFAESFGLNL